MNNNNNNKNETNPDEHQVSKKVSTLKTIGIILLIFIGIPVVIFGICILVILSNN